MSHGVTVWWLSMFFIEMIRVDMDSSLKRICVPGIYRGLRLNEKIYSRLVWL